MSRKDKISFFVITDSPKEACSVIRLLSPLKYLAREDIVELTYFFWDREDTDLDLDDLEDRWNSADIVIFQRYIPLEGMFLIREIAEKCKKIFVYEIDDNLMEIPQIHPHFFWHLANKRIIQAIISKSDAITTTTYTLAKYLKQLNPAVYVLPNLVDPELFLQSGNSKEKDKSDKIILGSGGTPSHLSDFHIIGPTIKHILEEYAGKVIFRLIGFSQEILGGISNNIESIPERYYMEYIKNLGNANLDIGLGPLNDNQFNRCKSNIKFLEYGMYGIPGIWSNIAPYAETVKDGENGILVKEHSSEVWYRAIKLLIVDDELRKKLSLNVKRTVLDKFLLPKYVNKWYKLYKSLVKKNKNLQTNRNDDQELFRKLFMIREGNYRASIRKYVNEAEREYEKALKSHNVILSIERAGALEEDKDQRTSNFGGIIHHYILGSSYRRQGIFKKAKEHFKKIINLRDEYLLVGLDKYIGGAHFHLGCIYKELGKNKESRGHLEECLKIIPEHKKARELLGVLEDE